MDVSIVSYYGIQTSRCGYCKGTKCSKAHGMHAYTMTPRDYQDLIDRGWRRSGEYCYKPHNSTTCCPSYTIKCDALQFKLTKSHKKILKRMNRFLRDGKKDRTDSTTFPIDVDEMQAELDMHDEPKAPNRPIPAVDINAVENANLPKHKVTSNKLELPDATMLVADVVDGAVSTAEKQQDTCNSQIAPPRKKAKQIRLERREAKLLAKGETSTGALPKVNPANSKQVVKSLADFIAETTPADKHKLKIVLKNSASLKVDQQTFNLYRKYETTVHKNPPERLTPTRLERFLYKSPLKLALIHVRAKEFSTTLDNSYALYEKYQTRIHKDPPDGVEDFLTFLGHSPLKLDMRTDGPPQGYGSFHQQYWLDDKLIAVGVIDILPHCLSSVYFFYDPEYSFLSLGTYASLREIELVQQLSQIVPDLKYYYMGFYIQSCPKMRYKGKLVPSYLLCPETYTWNLFTDEIRSALDESKYQRLNGDLTSRDMHEFTVNDLNNVLLLLERNKFATFGECVESNKKPIAQLKTSMFEKLKRRLVKQFTGEEFDVRERDMIFEYATLVGKICAHRMIYVNM